MADISRVKTAEQLHQQAEGFLKHGNTQLKAGHDLYDQSSTMYSVAFLDATNAVKLELQAFLMRAAEQADDQDQRARLHMLATSEVFPVLLERCLDLGLDIQELDNQLRSNNMTRNRRIHEDAAEVINRFRATEAMKLAKAVKARVAFEQVHAAASASSLSSSAPPQTNSAQEHEAGPRTDMVLLGQAHPGSKRRIGQRVRYVGQIGAVVAAVVALVLLGTALGIGVTVTGRAPLWVSRLAPQGTPSRSQSITPTPSVAAPMAAIRAGNVRVVPQACSGGAEPLTLTNDGTVTEQWALGGIGGAGATPQLTASQSGNATATLFGTLAYVTDGFMPPSLTPSLALTTSDGAAPLPVIRC